MTANSTSGLAGEAVAKPLSEFELGPGCEMPRSCADQKYCLGHCKAVPPSIPAGGVRWLPIEFADKSIATVQKFGDVELRNSYPIWARDEDGRTYEAVWNDHKHGYWWDLEAESPVDPVEFAPHPLSPEYASTPSLPAGGVAVSDAMAMAVYDELRRRLTLHPSLSQVKAALEAALSPEAKTGERS